MLEWWRGGEDLCVTLFLVNIFKFTTEGRQTNHFNKHVGSGCWEDLQEKELKLTRSNQQRYMQSLSLVKHMCK